MKNLNDSEPCADSVVVVAAETADQDAAAAVSARLGIPLAGSPEGAGAALVVAAGGLSLRSGKSVIRVDFVSGDTARRGRRAGGERLVQALGRKGPRGLQVLDATAGLGRDAFLLASAGCEVTLLERNPVLHLLLEDALARAAADPSTAAVAARMCLERADSVAWMRGCPDGFDVVCLDPMFPPRSKSAAVRKEAQILQLVAGHGGRDGNDDDLGEAARQTARSRVIVKRPQHAPNLYERAPDYVLAGRSTRFDVYLVTGW